MKILPRSASARVRPTPAEIAAWIIASSILIAVLFLHLLPALLAGLLVFELVHLISPWIARHVPGQRAKLIAIGFLSFLVATLLVTASLGLVAFFRSDSGSLTRLFAKMSDIIGDSRQIVPSWLVTYLPSDAETIKKAVSTWLSTHAAEVQLAGTEVGRLVVRILIGMIIGALLALHEMVPMEDYQPLARALTERAERIRLAFHRIVFAQVRIASINTALTVVYLMIILPLTGVHLPLTKTMIAITFIVGLIPVIGNLISNTVIVIVSLSHSLEIAIGSLTFLLFIHKMEYFLNARIVGNKIHAQVWELLLAMLLMEAAFGLVGLVAAPIYYAYLKDELVARNWI